MADVTNGYEITTGTLYDADKADMNVHAVTSVQKGYAAGTYTGNGAVGWEHMNSLTFDFVPRMVALHADDGVAILLNGAFRNRSSYSDTLFAYWNDKKVEWYHSGSQAYKQFNDNGVTYRYLALG